MCGIAGIFDIREARRVDRALLARMTDSLAHRGPDGRGVHVEPGLGLGHRRLSIIDLEAGQQPMASADGQVVVTFNGEIYNFRELRRELEAQGAQFATRSDTEVILHGWRAWGEGCVERFNGMFAFALWDRSRQTLFMARDRLGVKPLYYASLSTGHLIFGSELKALLLHPALPRRLHAPAVEDYFTFGYVPDPATILEGVHKLAPGHALTLRRGAREPRLRQYWDVAFAAELSDEGAVQDELIERLRGCVRQQMVSDVPLGAFLSGGVDSSAVVAMMADGAGDPITTCSIAFDEARFDETRFAQQVAERYHTRHFVDAVNAQAADDLDRLCHSYDEPFADSSAMPTHQVCRLARTHVTVALSGDGGDEGFAGYRRHRWSAMEAQVRRWVPPGLRRPLFGSLGYAYPKMDWAPRVLRAKSTLQALALDSVEGYLESVAITTRARRRALFSSQFEAELGGYRSLEVFRRHAEAANVSDALSLVQYLDFKTYLPGDILTKVDRASMAYGLEVRVPLLDHEFVGWVARISPELKLRGREGKYVFKKALEPYVPREVMYRPKMGFAVPLAQWLRGPLYERTRQALAERLPATGCFDRSSLLRVLEVHRSGVCDHSALLWALLMFDGFSRRVLAGESESEAIVA
ncbi:MAG TPA: XrtA/PEP-CTERM system amidotransferase [Gammaproteobacteria bacterium]|nr:XrtA/PEP-CTERM system amidotransferase [Gammaproteobacteria bacterium]